MGEVAAIAVERAIVTQHVAVDGNVRRQHGAGRRLTTIDQLSEPVKLPSVADLIGACIVLRGCLITAASAETVDIICAIMICTIAKTNHAMRWIKGWGLIDIRARQILPPWTVGAASIQQPRHLTGFVFVLGFFCRFATANANASVNSATQPVASRDVATVAVPADATDIAAAATDSAAVAAVCDGTVTVPPADAANIGAAAFNSTAVVAILDAPPIVPPADAADFIAASDGAAVAAIRDAAIIIPANAADIIAASDGAAVAAVCDAARVQPADAANIGSAGGASNRAAAFNSTAVVAILDAASVLSADAADIGIDVAVASDDPNIAVGQGEVLHDAAFADTAK